jgi:tRNA(fMet)-specific endonuclease VapC
VRRILIDTNIYSAFKSNDHEIVRALQTVDEIHVSTTVLGELLAGFKAGSSEARNRRELEGFLNRPRIYFDSIDAGTAEFYAHVYLMLRVKGAPIPTNDIWIAASAMQHGLALYSRDRHFTVIDGLIFVRP